MHGNKKDMVRRLVEASGESLSPRGGSSPFSDSRSPNLSLEPVAEEDGRELRRKAREKYEAMNMRQLRATCESSWLDESGSTEDMIKRLIDYDATTNDWPADRSPRKGLLGGMTGGWNRQGSGSGERGSGSGGRSGRRADPVDTDSWRAGGRTSSYSPQDRTPTAPRGGGGWAQKASVWFGGGRGGGTDL